jgi:hypothetical protein
MRARAFISMAAFVGPCIQHPMVLEKSDLPDDPNVPLHEILATAPVNVIDLAKENITREEFVARVALLAGGLYDLAKEL